MLFKFDRRHRNPAPAAPTVSPRPRSLPALQQHALHRQRRRSHAPGLPRRCAAASKCDVQCRQCRVATRFGRVFVREGPLPPAVLSWDGGWAPRASLFWGEPLPGAPCVALFSDVLISHAPFRCLRARLIPPLCRRPQTRAPMWMRTHPRMMLTMGGPPKWRNQGQRRANPNRPPPPSSSRRPP